MSGTDYPRLKKVYNAMAEARYDLGFNIFAAIIWLFIVGIVAVIDGVPYWMAFEEMAATAFYLAVAWVFVAAAIDDIIAPAIGRVRSRYEGGTDS